MKPDPGSGFAVNVTDAPLLKLKTQVTPQSMPAGELVMLPVPLPEGVTVSAY